MPRRAKKSKAVTCKCVSLHTYPAYVYASSWDVVIHFCDCGREHINEQLVSEPVTTTRRKSKR